MRLPPRAAQQPLVPLSLPAVPRCCFNEKKNILRSGTIAVFGSRGSGRTGSKTAQAAAHPGGRTGPSLGTASAPFNASSPLPGALRGRGCIPRTAPVPPGLPPRTARGRRGSPVAACARPAGIRRIRFAAPCSCGLDGPPCGQRVRNSAVRRCAPICGKQRCPSAFGMREARLCLPPIPFAMGAQFAGSQPPVRPFAPSVPAPLLRGQA